MKISVVVPVYRAERYLKELYSRLKTSLEKITDDFEIILVDDSSDDRSWEIINGLAVKDLKIKGIQFSRNFGQHYAITAGLDCCNGDWVVVMDCDLQDQPEEIDKLYKKANSGHDVVFARRINRKDNFLKKFSSLLFYNIHSYFADAKFDHTIANFSISKKKVIDNFRKLREHNRFFPLFIKWTGFNIGFVDVKHGSANERKSTYTFKKLLNLAMDTIISQSNKPLRLSIKFGFLLSFFSFLFGVWIIAKKIVFGVSVSGWTSLIVSLYFIAGLLLANMGILGLYIGKTFDETKNRPLYIIKEMTGIMQDD